MYFDTLFFHTRTNASHTSLHSAQECYIDALNFFSEVDISKMEFILEHIAEKTSGETRAAIEYLIGWMQELDDVALDSCQKLLFDLPLFYVGRYSSILCLWCVRYMDKMWMNGGRVCRRRVVEGRRGGVGMKGGERWMG